ncbi:MAG: hypothetical protein KJ749_10330, partial [Planctomycetes bacterium]|nr:hypothetical protein [Planctomycetota bacterium]
MPNPGSELAATFRELTHTSRSLRIAIVGIFAGSVLLRGLILASATPVLVSDARDYHVLAKNLAAGQGYIQHYEGETAAFNGFTFRAFRPPGYPIILAGLGSIFGWSLHVPLVANIAADLVTQACLLLIALRLFGIGSAVAVQV